MPLHGIDCSNHNHPIDPTAVPGEFVICRASEGKGMRDEHFAEYDAKIRPSAKLAGAYHFCYVQGNTPQQEAANFAAAIKDHLRPGFLTVCDWEPKGVLARQTGWAVDFAHEVKRLTGRTPILYANQSTLDVGDWSRWRAEIGTAYWLAGGTPQYAQRTDGYTPGVKPRNPYGFGDPAIWQYTEHGYLPGWGKRLDLNIFYGDAADWRRLADPKEQLVTIPPLRERITLRDSEGRTFLGCTCMQLMMPIYDLKLREAGLVTRGIDVMQGGYRGDVKASAGTHNRGGVFDMRPLRDHRKAIEIGQRLGLIVFNRDWPGNRHYHVLVLGCPHMHPEAYAQLHDRRIGYVYGKDGLANPGTFWGPRGLAPDGGWQQAYRAFMAANAQPAVTQRVTPPKEEEVPKFHESTVEFDHPGGWALPPWENVAVPARDKPHRIQAEARVHVADGVTVHTRWVSWDDRNKAWVRYAETVHATGQAETTMQVDQAWGGADLRLDVWCDKPGKVWLNQSSLGWEL